MTQVQAKWLASTKTQLPTHIQQLSEHLQQMTLLELTNQLDYKNLRLSFEAYIDLIAPEGSKQTDIARTLRISKQSCNQLVKDIEAAGYIKRLPDPEDGRGKLLKLTSLGQSLKSDGINAILKLENQLLDICGKSVFDGLKKDIITLCKNFGVPYRIFGEHARFSSLLFRLSDFISQHLFNTITLKGHPHLKPSYGQVLKLMSRNKINIQQLASHNNVSKQATGVIVNQLEKSGYITRQTSNNDRRQIFYCLTKQGRALLTLSSECVDELHQQFQIVLGKPRLKKFEETFQILVEGLQLPSSLSHYAMTTNTELLAKELIEELGNEQALDLAKILTQKLSIN